jgi:hypothetical protein
MEPEHATDKIEFETKFDGRTRGHVTCICGETMPTDWHDNQLRARRAAENEFRKHREFRMMHVGLFEDMP